MNNRANESGDQQPTLITMKEVLDGVNAEIDKIPGLNNLQKTRISQKAMTLLFRMHLDSYTLVNVRNAVEKAKKITQSGQKDLAIQQREAIAGNLELVLPKQDDEDDDLSATG